VVIYQQGRKSLRIQSIIVILKKKRIYQNAAFVVKWLLYVVRGAKIIFVLTISLNNIIIATII